MPHQIFSHPVSLVCLTAPSDTNFLAQWENHLLPLQQAGLLTFWSERQMTAGTDRMAELVRHLDQADSVILLLSADFFADNTCLTLMHEALQRKSVNRTRLIPLLVRPVVWQESVLGTFAALPTNGVAIATWESPDEGWRQAVLGLQRLLGLPVYKTSSVSKGAATDRERLLRLLRRTYQTSLSGSLQGIAWIELGLSEHPDAVRNATHLLQRLPNRTERLLPAGTSILSVYDQAEEELLILGAPGTGKSTLLLDLAMGLIARAEDEPTHPLPMIVPLSSWAERRPPFAEWLVEQLARIYDIPRRLGKLWIEQGQLLPLLDGLDEMEEAARPLCIAEINTYHREHLGPLVVCSRQAEYEAASIRERLLLQNAVIVQALRRDQADNVIRECGPALSELHDALLKNPTMRDLTMTPLMLSVLILAYRDRTIGNLPREQAQLEERVWTDYVERMVREKGAAGKEKGNASIKRYSLKLTRSCLSWLAQQMSLHNQTLFDGESLQETWLPTSQQQAIRWLGGHLPTIVLGVLSSLFLALFLFNINLLQVLIQVGLLGVFLGWCESREQHKSVTSMTVQRMLEGSCAGLLTILFIASFSVKDPGLPSFNWEYVAFVIGSPLFVGAWLLQIQFARMTERPARAAFQQIFFWPRLIQRLGKPSHQRALWAGMILGSSLGLGYGLAFGFLEGLIEAIGFGTGTGAIVSLVNIVLQAQTGTVQLTGQIRWNWRGWRDILRVRYGCTSVVVALVFFCLYGLSYGLNAGLSFGLSSGLSYWIVVGLYQGFMQEHLETQDRRRFNQGLHRCLRNSLLLSAISAVIITGINLVGNLVSNRLDSELDFGLNSGHMLSLFLSSWLLVWAATGALTILRHYAVRLLLVRSHTFPLNARRFLDDACARVLLRRVGGGYGFVHRRLLDYFAALSDAPEPSHLSTVPLVASLSESVPTRICHACSYQETRPQARFCSHCGSLSFINHQESEGDMHYVSPLKNEGK